MLKNVTGELNKLIPIANNDDDIQKMLANIKKRSRSMF
jgi:hypothetical protein